MASWRAASILSIVTLLTFLAGCAQRGEIRLVPEARGIGTSQEVLFASVRAPIDGLQGQGSNRSDTERYGRIVLSVPPDREAGSLRWPPKDGAADARRDFLTLEQQAFDNSRDFRSFVRKRLAARPRAGREVVLFVHGFNTNFAESAYRVAQLSHDLGFPGLTMLYSWPSKASALAYVYDRESALFARDGLDRLFSEIVAGGAEEIVVIGHSMGGALVMEALRQAALRHDKALLSRLAGVVLISPDIDVDVFRKQAQAVGPLRSPITVFTSSRDRALALSALVARDSNRLGNLDDISRLEGVDVVLLEVGAFSTGLGHMTVGTSPTLIALLNRIREIDDILAGDAARYVGLLPGAILTVRGVTRVILSPVTVLAEELN